MSYDTEGVRWVVHSLFITIGEGPERDRLRDAPECVVHTYAEISAGLNQGLTEHIERVFDAGYEKMALVCDIPMYSACEYHLLPFYRSTHMGYIPSKDGRVTGLSKVTRLVDGYARRPQVQERLTQQIVSVLVECLQRRGVPVIVEAEHPYILTRGVCKPGFNTVTSAVRDIMYNAAARSEIMSLALSRQS